MTLRLSDIAYPVDASGKRLSPSTATPAPTLATMPLDAQTTRDLSRAAANVRTWTEKRNALIRAAFAVGGGIREIAKATGLNVGTVHTMLHGRKR